MQDLTEGNYVLYCVCLQPFLEMEEGEGSKQKQPGFIICSSLWLSLYPLACQTQSLKTPTHCLSSSKYTKVSNTTLTQSALPQPKWKYCTSNTWWKSRVHATLSFQKSATVPIHFPVDPQQQRTCCYFRHKGNVIRSCTYLQVRGDGSLCRLSGSPLLHGERGKNSAFPCKSSSQWNSCHSQHASCQHRNYNCLYREDCYVAVHHLWKSQLDCTCWGDLWNAGKW